MRADVFIDQVRRLQGPGISVYTATYDRGSVLLLAVPSYTSYLRQAPNEPTPLLAPSPSTHFRTASISKAFKVWFLTRVPLHSSLTVDASISVWVSL